MIDKRLANQYGDVIAICRALKPHASNLLFVDDEGHTMLQALNGGILNWARLNTEEVDISPFVHTYMNIPQATSVNSKFKKTKSDIDWVVHDDQRFLKVSNPDGTEMEQPIISSKNRRNEFYQRIYARLQDQEHCGGALPLKDIPDYEFEELPMDLCAAMVAKKQCKVVVGGHEIWISRPFLGDLKKTEWLGAKILYIREPGPNEEVRKATVYFKQREPLMEVYTYGAFLILEED